MLELNIKKKLNNFTLDIECKLNSNRIGILGGSGAGKSMILKDLMYAQRVSLKRYLQKILSLNLWGIQKNYRINDIKKLQMS